MKTISSSKFDFNSTENIFSIDASELGKVEFVYNDACDLGFTMISARTGEEVFFVEVQTVRDSEGDVRYWVYIPTEKSTKSVRGCKGTKVFVFNT